MGTAHWDINCITLPLANPIWTYTLCSFKESKYISCQENFLQMNRVARPNRKALLAQKFCKGFRILATKNKPFGKPVSLTLTGVDKNVPGVGYINVKPS